jgi:hypothetical protein
MMIVSFDLHLLALIFNRTIHGFEYAYDFSALDSAAYWALPQPHALQEMTALILERLRGFDPRTNDVAVANLKAKLAVVQRLFLHRAYAFLKDAHLLKSVEIIENDAPVTPDDDNLASLIRIGPAHMNVTDDVARVPERDKSHIVAAVSQDLAAHRADPLRHAVKQVIENGDVMRGEIP